MIYPPRPTRVVPASMLDYLEMHGWKAQLKLDGMCIVIMEDGTTYSRHGLKQTMRFPHGLDAIFIAEWCQAKPYVFDVIKYDGATLVGIPSSSRMRIIKRLPHPLYTIPWIEKGYKAFFSRVSAGFLKTCDIPIMRSVEGLVLRNPKTTLEPCDSTKHNRSGMVKCKVHNVST